MASWTPTHPRRLYEPVSSSEESTSAELEEARPPDGRRTSQGSPFIGSPRSLGALGSAGVDGRPLQVGARLRHLLIGVIAFVALIILVSSLNSRPTGNDTLILYAFFETDDALNNLQFFLRHGMHSNADFIFVVNGETNFTGFPISERNVRLIQRPNDCYDMGAYGDVLTRDGRALVRRYKKFILLNASVMGPFIPHWSRECWSNAYLSRLSSQVKLVGMTANCIKAPWVPLQPHLQSMILATDRAGLQLLLDDRSPHSLGSCPEGHDEAVQVEVSATTHILAAGYQVDAMMQEFQSIPDPTRNYIDKCDHDDFLYDHVYFGGNIHPYETIFAKTKRGIDDQLLEKLQEWTDLSKYSSYDYC